MNEIRAQEQVQVDDSVQVRARTPSKIELKRQQIYIDRMKRHMAAGMTQEAAHAAIGREDYERLPVADKLGRIERVFSQAHGGLAKDIQEIHSNQVDLADTMDVNFRAFGKMLERLGLKPEDQKACFEAAQAEMALELKAAKEAELKEQVEAPGEEAPTIPEGATQQE